MKKSKPFSNSNIIIALTIIFVLWLLLWDQNNMSNLSRVNQEIKNAKSERMHYQKLIKADSLVITGLKDSAYVERYARENYFYSREEESLYLIEDSSQN